MGYVHNVWCHLHQSEDDLHGNKAFKSHDYSVCGPSGFIVHVHYK